MGTILIRNIHAIIGTAEGPEANKASKGAAMSRLGTVDHAYLLIENGLISAFGPESEAPPERADKVIDAGGGMVFPAWCDSHTHIVYARSRETEFVDRIKGKTYEEIALAGGGILNSARVLEHTSEDELYESALTRLMEMIKKGTGAVEIKSGYGLTPAAELKMLRVIQRLKSLDILPIKSTFLGAHAVPAHYKHNRQGYIDQIIYEMLPVIAAENLADYCDVFCDKGFFTVAETDRILKAAAKYGLKPKIHANELDVSGGVQVGVENNAVSVDHLERTTQAEIDVLRNSHTIPTLLPGASFFLNIPFGDARSMIDQGLGPAIATDCNPGSAPSGNMSFIVSLACIRMKMTPAEAINAATINGACAMELQDITGNIAKDKLANLFITSKIPSIDYFPYSFGSDLIQKTILKGKEY